MKKVYAWGTCLSAAALMTLAAAVNAQQPVPAVNSTPQPVTAYTPAAPGAIDRDSDALQPQPDAATQTELGDRQNASEAGVPSAFGQLRQQTITGTTQSGQTAGEQSMMAGGQRGELGVWLASTGGAGVEVRRITAGGPAERAGLQAGDIILQVNGQGATSPQAISQLIRRMPPGQAITIEVWRNGQQQELQAMLRPYQEQYQTAYRGESMGISGSGDIAARTMRLEEQLTMVMQELRQLRQEIAQLRTSAGSATTSAAGAFAQPESDPGFGNLDQPAAPPATAQPGAGLTEPAATTAPADAADQPDPFGDDTAASAAEPTTEPAAEPATEPAAEDEDVFGSETTEDAGAAETEVAPAESTETEAESDSLFE